MKFIIPHPLDLDEPARKRIYAYASASYDTIPHSEEEIIARISDADVITANYFTLTSKILKKCPNLRYIIVPAVGLDFVDLAYTSKHGIQVLNCPNHNAVAVAEHAFGLLLSLLRDVTRLQQLLTMGEWGGQKEYGLEINNKKVGLYGYGNIGKRIAQIAASFGAHVTHINSLSKRAEREKLLSSSDIIFLCLPYSNSTHGIIGRKELSLLKRSAILVNVARGKILDQEALIDSLLANRFRGYATDVFDDEPLVGAPDRKITELAKLPNVIATPHVGYRTIEARKRLGDEILNNLELCKRKLY